MKICQNKTRIITLLLVLLMISESFGMLSLYASEASSGNAYIVSENTRIYENNEEIYEMLNMTDLWMEEKFLGSVGFNTSHSEELEILIDTLANSTSFYTSLSEEDRLTMLFELSVREDTMSELETYGLNIRDSIIKAQLMQMFDISATDAFTLVGNHNSEEQAMEEASRLRWIMMVLPHLATQVDILTELFIEGYTVDELISLIVVFNMTDIEMIDLAYRGELLHIETPSIVVEDKVIEEDLEKEHEDGLEDSETYEDESADNMEDSETYEDLEEENAIEVLFTSEEGSSIDESSYKFELNVNEVMELARSYTINPQVLYDFLLENMVSIEMFQQGFREVQRHLNLFRSNDIMPMSAGDEPVSGVSVSAPFDFSRNSRETVNLNTGALIYIDEIVSLRGRGGFNLNLALRYDSSTATEDAFHGADRFVYMAQLVNGNFQPMGDWRGFFTLPFGVNVIREAETRPQRYIASGWSLNQTRIEVKGDRHSPGQRILRLASGGSYEIRQEPWPHFETLYLKDYLLDDIKIAVDRGTFQASTHVVSYANGLREYFNIDGFLVAQVDRHRNIITYVDTGNRLTITHNTGEQVIIDFNPQDIVVTLPDRSIIRYQRTMPPEGSLELPVLTQKIDQIGNITKFNYSQLGARFNFFSTNPSLPSLNLPRELWEGVRDPGGQNSAYFTDLPWNTVISIGSMSLVSVQSPNPPQPWGHPQNVLAVIPWFGILDTGIELNINASPNGNHHIRYALLTSVEYPTGLISNYSYKREIGSLWRHQSTQWNLEGWWVSTGFIENFVLSERWDTTPSSNARHNHIRYEYSEKNFTHFRRDLFSNDTYSVIETRGVGIQAHHIEHIYNYKHLRVEERHYRGSVSNANLFRVVRYEYSDKNLPIRVEREEIGRNGNIVAIDLFEYDNFGNITHHWNSQAEGERNNEFLTRFTYDRRFNMLTSKTYKMNPLITVGELYLLSPDGRSVIQTNINGRRTDFEYDGYGNVISTTRSVNNTERITERITYDARGVHPTSITRGEITTTFTYDAMGNVLSVRDGNGNITRFGYDRLGREVTRTQANGSVILTTYDDKNNTLRITDELRHTMVYYYTALGQLSRIEEQETGNVVASFVYGLRGELLSETDALGNTTNFTYDHLMRVTSRISGDFVEQTEYIDVFDSNRRAVRTTVLGSNGAPTQVTTAYINKHGLLVAESGMLNGEEVIKSYTHDYVGNVLSVLNPEHKSLGLTQTIWNQYDAFGNVIVTTNALGQAMRNAYDFLGRRTVFIDASGSRFEYVYDIHGNLIEERIPFDGTHHSIRRFTYDRNNNLLSESVTIQKSGEPERLSQTFYTYDVMNRLIMVESAGEFTKYEYDLAGNLVRMITGNGQNVHTYEYDRNGNVIRYIDAEGLEELYVYDLNGNLIEKTDRNGNVIRHVYDDLGRLVETIGRVEPSIEEQEIAMARYEYSRNGLLILEENENITIRHQYDSLGRLIRSTQSDGVVTTHTYDRNNNRLSMRMYLNGELTAYTRYEYDLLDRMVRVFADGVLEAEYSYDVNGNRSSLSYPLVGVQTTYRFNRANLVTEVVNRVNGEIVSSFEYFYYLDGNQFKILENCGTITMYEYDYLRRLTREEEIGERGHFITEYWFDESGNRLWMISTVDGEVSITAYVYDRNNRLLQDETIELNTETVTINKYTYDNNGNKLMQLTNVIGVTEADSTPSFGIVLLRDGADAEAEGYTKIFTYDILNRLVRYESSGTIAEYTYRPDSLRIAKTVNGEETRHIWDGMNMIADVKGDNVVVFIRGINLIRSTEHGWYLFNARGDVVQLLDNNGNIIREYRYDAFGVERFKDENDTNPFRYTGEYFDRETGMIYLRMRFYIPHLGRFLNEDPIRDGLNWYTYVNGNPIMFIDPWGLSAEGWAQYISQLNSSLEQTQAGSEDHWAILSDLLSAIQQFDRSIDLSFYFSERRLVNTLSFSQMVGVLGVYIINTMHDPIIRYIRSLGFSQAYSEAIFGVVHLTISASRAGMTGSEYLDFIMGMSYLGVGANFTSAANSATSGTVSGAKVIRKYGAADLNELYQKSGRRTVMSGTSQAPKHSRWLANSIYEQFHHDGRLMSRSFYDKNGHNWLRFDFLHDHGGLMPHQHHRLINAQGRPITPKSFGPLPSWASNTPLSRR